MYAYRKDNKKNIKQKKRATNKACEATDISGNSPEKVMKAVRKWLKDEKIEFKTSNVKEGVLFKDLKGQALTTIPHHFRTPRVMHSRIATQL